MADLQTNSQCTTAAAPTASRAAPAASLPALSFAHFPRVGGRPEPLALFGALAAGLLIASIAACAAVLMQSVRREERDALTQNAPAIMKVVCEALEPALNAPPEILTRRANDALRLPAVWSCKIQRVPTVEGAAEASQPAASQQGGKPPSKPETFAAGPVDVPPGALVLEAPLNGAGRTGRAFLTFVPRSDAWLGALVWTGGGAVAIGALVLFAVAYRVVGRRLRALQFVRDNLMAYHTGVERSLELLALQGQAAEETRAWNSLIDTVREMQRELDGHRTRQAVVGSMQSLHSQSARAILDSLPIGVLRINAEGRLAYNNEAARRLLSMTTEADGDSAIANRLGNAELAGVIAALWQAPGGTGQDFRLEHGGNHTIVRLLPMLVPELGEDEVVITVQDITQLKEAERSREEFLTHITHELRTPLTNIRAYSETLSEDFFDDEQTRRECYNVIMSETRRLSKLIEDVLSASQIDAGVARLNRQQVRIDQSLRKAVHEVQASADGKKVELSLKLSSKLPLALGDSHRLHQVWINLIGNAVKYTPSGGSVAIDATGDAQFVRVRVSDTGIGIPPEFHERIFEKFFRVQDARVEAEEGTGLGLAITREIVRLHGGSIKVESQPGTGTTFVVELPVARDSNAPARGEVADAANRGR